MKREKNPTEITSSTALFHFTVFTLFIFFLQCVRVSGHFTYSCLFALGAKYESVFSECRAQPGTDKQKQSHHHLLLTYNLHHPKGEWKVNLHYSIEKTFPLLSALCQPKDPVTPANNSAMYNLTSNTRAKWQIKKNTPPDFWFSLHLRSGLWWKKDLLKAEI